MDWLLIDIRLPLWEFLMIALYVLVAHAYVTFRVIKLVFIAKHTPINNSQNNRIDNKINNGDHDIHNIPMPIKDIKNNINNNCDDKTSNKPSG
jgi:hypothetical protein